MAKVLVTGGAGLIGSNLVRALLPENDVYVVDNLWRGKQENLLSDEGHSILKEDHFIEKDLRDYQVCRSVSESFDCVYHLADIVAGINYVFSNEYSLYQTNTLINTNMLRACVENGIRKYIYVGTACSFPLEKQSRLDSPPLREEDTYPANPESSYGWSKLMGEYEAELAMKEKLLDVGVLRLHNVYGPPCELSPEKSQVIPALCRKALQHPSEDFIVWGSGQQKRAFVYVDDVVEALLAVRERGLNEGVIQIGPSQSVSIADIAEKIVKISGKSISITFDRDKPEGDKDRTADFSKASRLLNWKPRTSIDDGLQKTFIWCQKYLQATR